MSTQYLSPGSPYRDDDVGPGIVLATLIAMRCVLDADTDKLADIHAQGTRLAPALEYAAQMGKHPVTQHLLMMGVPVTRRALQRAAQRRGPGVDLLLAGIRPEDKAQACSAALTFRMVAGDFQKAYEMLDAGVVPDRYFVSGAFSGTAKLGDQFEATFHEALDYYLPRVPREVLERSHLGFVIEHGRPVHIDRMIERLQRPVAFLMRFAFTHAGDERVRRLREFGCPIDDAAFGVITHEMPWECHSNLWQLTRLLCEFVHADGHAGTISAAHVEPIINAAISQKAPLIRVSIPPGSSEQHDLTAIFSQLTPCMKAEERGRLHSMLDNWQNLQHPSVGLEYNALHRVHAILDEVALGIPNPWLDPTPTP